MSDLTTMQDPCKRWGAADFDNHWGSWAVANLDMAAALKFRGYDHRLEFGRGGHDLAHAAAIWPSTLRWIWRTTTRS